MLVEYEFDPDNSELAVKICFAGNESSSLAFLPSFSSMHELSQLPFSLKLRYLNILAIRALSEDRALIASPPG